MTFAALVVCLVSVAGPTASGQGVAQPPAEERMAAGPSLYYAAPIADTLPPEPPPEAFDPDGQAMPASYGAAPEPAAEPKYVTSEELEAGFKKYAWKKGDFQIIPYGFATASAIYESARTSPGEFTIFVLPENTAGESAFYVDAKSSRLGIDVLGPKLPHFGCPQTAAKLEFDFQGQFETANRSGLLFRQAYVEVKNDDYRILAGQSWEVMSQLYPGLLMYVPGSGAGNLGFRRANVRYERYLTYSERTKFTLEGSINADIISDLLRVPGAVGHPAGWPVLEGRATVLMGRRDGPDARPVLAGVSAHIGEMQYDFTGPGNGVSHRDLPTWSFNVELRIPLTAKMGVQSELFIGENLSSFMGGILQGVDPGTRDTIGSQGGWIDVWYDFSKKLHAHSGFLIDDPFNADMTTGRTYQHVIFGNLVYNIMPNFDVGIELSDWKTNWINNLPGESVRCEMQTKYRF